MSCCNSPEIKYVKDIGELCQNCFSITSDLQLEITCSDKQTKCQLRSKKFFNIIIQIDLPWYVRQTMLDLFTTVESHFPDSNRKNFVHLGQLAVELLLIAGYPEHTHHFSQLKTKSRIKTVKQFVKDAFPPAATLTQRLPRLEDLELIELKTDYKESHKVVKENHIFSDKDIKCKNRYT